ncbi:MAG: hypothetical protein PHW18_03140 [Sulfuricurvum sp.]|uniref:hypothetical protein n=1 Tax=Sulfuricurvum sp. TaxID=2025608 RepID=UPI002627B98D|nr:hypothetical protein [Sulfuricurvum sp.]MDD2828554.1 hypothetical protein [Sulfuricurvum sp.]MDD4948915.1 hypothetical protein [Sulfuricurvum sp.]
MRFSIDEYAKTFKMSKEMIHNKLKSKKLNYIIEGGVTYIIVPRNSLNDTQKTAVETPIKPSPPAPNKTSIGMVISLYQKENLHLKLKIKELEAKIDALVNDKEQMLIAERNRIEEIYTAKDEQLKSILEVLSTKLLLTQNNNTIHDVDVSHQQQQPQPSISLGSSGLIELKRYLKFIGIGSEGRKLVRNRFSERYGSDVRIIQKEGEFYVDLSKYDYTDLL